MLYFNSITRDFNGTSDKTSYYGSDFNGTLADFNSISSFEDLRIFSYPLDHLKKIDNYFSFKDTVDIAMELDGEKIYRVEGNVVVFSTITTPRIIPCTPRILDILHDEGYVESELLFVPYSSPLSGPSDSHDYEVWKSLFQHALDIRELVNSWTIKDWSVQEERQRVRKQIYELKRDLRLEVIWKNELKERLKQQQDESYELNEKLEQLLGNNRKLYEKLEQVQNRKQELEEEIEKQKEEIKEQEEEIKELRTKIKDPILLDIEKQALEVIALKLEGKEEYCEDLDYKSEDTIQNYEHHFANSLTYLNLEKNNDNYMQQLQNELDSMKSHMEYLKQGEYELENYIDGLYSRKYYYSEKLVDALCKIGPEERCLTQLKEKINLVKQQIMELAKDLNFEEQLEKNEDLEREWENLEKNRARRCNRKNNPNENSIVFEDYSPEDAFEDYLIEIEDACMYHLTKNMLEIDVIEDKFEEKSKYEF